MTVELTLLDHDSAPLQIGADMKLVLLADGRPVADGQPQPDGTFTFDADIGQVTQLAVRLEPVA